mgnify:CR=1 FL=1
MSSTEKPIGYYLIVFFGRVIAVLPYFLQLTLGFSIGWLFFVFGKRRRKIAAINIDLAFPELSSKEHEKLVKRHFLAIGMSVVETMMSWFCSKRRLRKISSVKGEDNLQIARDCGNGVILAGFHFTTIEIAGGILSQQERFTALYRPHSNSTIESVYSDRRSVTYGGAIERNNIREMIRSLKKGDIVWYAPDQNFGGKNSLFSPFFGVPAATNTATSRLAEITNAKLVPIFFRRLPGLKGYEIEIKPALKNFPCGDLQKDTDRVNKLIEDFIRRCPEQYLWMHRRYKDRPNGETRFY